MAGKDDESKERKEGEKPKLSAPPPTKKSIILKNLLYVLLVALTIVGILADLSFDPQDLSDVEGYESDSSRLPVGGRDLGAVLKDAEKNKRAVRITEEELNKYLRRTLKFEQGGWFKSFITARGAWIKLEEAGIEVIIEREIASWDRRHTVSMLLEIEQTVREDGGVDTTGLKRKWGKWGRSKVINGFVMLTQPSFRALKEAYSEEIKRFWRMLGSFQIKISDGEIKLTPPEAAPLRKKS